MEFMSETHKSVVRDDGLLKVFSIAPRRFTIQHYLPDGGVTMEWVTAENAVTDSDKRLLMNMNRMPLFAATYAGGSEWHLDLDCGAQRWIGVKKTGAVSSALSKCGFDLETTKKILAECRKHKWDFVPRQG
jgi:hypothetical protein